MIPGDGKKISTNFFLHLRETERERDKGDSSFIRQCFPGSDGKECDDGGKKVQKWEVLEREEKRTIVLMVVGDAANTVFAAYPLY